MITLIITLNSPGPRGTLDLELPGEVPLRNLLPELARVLQLPPTDSAGRSITYQLVCQKPEQARGQLLRETDTLQGAGVVTGEILSLAVGVLPAHTAPRGAGGSYAGAPALLRCASGKVIALDKYGKLELTLGRYDVRTGKSPDIDLSEEPAGDTVSRSHALLRKQGSQWTLMPLSARNPTQVGGTRLAPRQSHLLRSGDVIALGAVKLTFT